MEQQNPGQRPQSLPMPRWVKLSLIVIAGLAVLAAVALLSGHGPAQHGQAWNGSARQASAAPWS